jgi:hypothetical protein
MLKLCLSTFCRSLDETATTVRRRSFPSLFGIGSTPKSIYDPGGRAVWNTDNRCVSSLVYTSSGTVLQSATPAMICRKDPGQVLHANITESKPQGKGYIKTPRHPRVSCSSTAGQRTSHRYIAIHSFLLRNNVPTRPPFLRPGGGSPCPAGWHIED